MKSSSAVKLAPMPTNSKLKKNAKEREKRKSHFLPSIEITATPAAYLEKTSPTKESSNRKYTGYGPDQFNNILEQCSIEHITEEASSAFTEDINYKLRHIIYDALAQARLLGRNIITSADVNETFECLHIEKIYGSSSNPNWIAIGDQTLYYLDDIKINLIQLSENCCLSFVQPCDSVITRKWLPEKKEGCSKNLKLYFGRMCEAIVAKKDMALSDFAIRDIATNTLIGPIVEWFYNFGYILLSKDITYGALTLRALKLIMALELNPVCTCTVPEKQIQLLAVLLLQRLLRPLTLPFTIKPICKLLAMLCRRAPLRRRVLIKLVIKFGEMKAEHALPILCAVNELGIDAVLAVILPNLNFLLSLVDYHKRTELTNEILRCYYILIRQQHDHSPVHEIFYDTFGDGILPMLRYRQQQHNFTDAPLQMFLSSLESNWLEIRTRLLKSRHRANPPTNKDNRRQAKISFEDVFLADDEREDEDSCWQWGRVKHPTIKFKFITFKPTVGRTRFLNVVKKPFSNHSTSCSKKQVIIGKRSLLCSVFQNTLRQSKCMDHSLFAYNL